MLADVLHKVAAMRNEEDGGEHAYYPRPSIAGPERCIRQMVYWARGEEARPIPGRSLVVMNDSGWHEELTADLIRQSAFQLHSQQMPVTLPNVFPWEPDEVVKCKVCDEKHNRRDMHGHTDFLVTDLADQDRLIEHKALSHFSWEELAGGALPLDYLTQLAIYLRGLGLVNPELTRGLLLVKNKNTSGYLEIDCTYNHETDQLHVLESRTHTGDVRPIDKVLDRITNEAIERFQRVHDYLTQGKLPLRQYSWDHWRCDYCQFNQACWGNYVEEHSAFKADAQIGGWAYSTLTKYRELGEQESEIKKARDGLKSDIKATLTRLGVRDGVAGDIAVKWDVTKVMRLDPELLPVTVREAATKETMQERLTVRRLKGDKKGATK